MGLRLAFANGDVFYVGDNRYVVTSVKEEGGAVIKGPDGAKHEVSSKKAVEIEPSVNIWETTKELFYEVGLMFEAPQSKTILREKLYKTRKGAV
jgi:hypothetical protein